jgi:hypothetical protein
VLIRRILLGGPAAVRWLACGLGPAPSFGGPSRDEGVVGSGEPAQGGGLSGERLVVPALGGALEDSGHLGQQVGPACGKFAEFGHRGGLLVPGEVAPSGVVPGGSGELGDQEPVSSRHETILVHLARIERTSGYLKQAGELSRQSRSGVAVSSDIPGCQLPTGTASATCRQGTRTKESSTYRDRLALCGVLSRLKTPESSTLDTPAWFMLMGRFAGTGSSRRPESRDASACSTVIASAAVVVPGQPSPTVRSRRETSRR